TVIAGFSGEIWINMSGNPSMAKGGSGDVLSGMIAAALARRAVSIAPVSDQSRDLQRVSAAVHLHGLAGDWARDQETENAVLATHLLQFISNAFRNCHEQVAGGLLYV